MKKLGSGTHSTVSNYRKETGNATQMGKKAHLELARSGLFVSEIADAEREREKFLHLSFSQRNLEDSRYERNYFVKAKDILNESGSPTIMVFTRMIFNYTIFCLRRVNGGICAS